MKELEEKLEKFCQMPRDPVAIEIILTPSIVYVYINYI